MTRLQLSAGQHQIFYLFAPLRNQHIRTAKYVTAFHEYLWAKKIIWGREAQNCFKTESHCLSV